MLFRSWLGGAAPASQRVQRSDLEISDMKDIATSLTQKDKDLVLLLASKGEKFTMVMACGEEAWPHVRIAGAVHGRRSDPLRFFRVDTDCPR